MIEKTVEVSLLYDFYSQLLTERQREMIDLYYNQDFSLGEIAEELDISRQAVYDTIKRTEKILYEYEEKLKLVYLFQQKNLEMKNILEKVIDLEKSIDNGSTKEHLKKQIVEIKGLFNTLLNL